MSAASADLTKLAQDLASAGNVDIHHSAERLIQQAAQRVQAEAQTKAPVKSGRLRDSISIIYPNRTTAIIGPQVEYGVYQEFGTGERGEFPGTSYQIRPKKGKYLKFKIGSKWVYARLVTHPGVKARRYMRDGLEAALGEELTDKLARSGALLITKGSKADV